MIFQQKDFRKIPKKLALQITLEPSSNIYKKYFFYEISQLAAYTLITSFIMKNYNYFWLGYNAHYNLYFVNIYSFRKNCSIYCKSEGKMQKKIVKYLMRYLIFLIDRIKKKKSVNYFQLPNKLKN